MSLHDKKGLDKRNRKGWPYDMILVHLKEFAPLHKDVSKIKWKKLITLSKLEQIDLQ
jgi:hypothetical protein